MNTMLIYTHRNISGIIFSAVDTKPIDYNGKTYISENEDSVVQWCCTMCCFELKAVWGNI
jgi:hypothetical protein